MLRERVKEVSNARIMRKYHIEKPFADEIAVGLATIPFRDTAKEGWDKGAPTIKLKEHVKKVFPTVKELLSSLEDGFNYYARIHPMVNKDPSIVKGYVESHEKTLKDYKRMFFGKKGVITRIKDEDLSEETKKVVPKPKSFKKSAYRGDQLTISSAIKDWLIDPKEVKKPKDFEKVLREFVEVGARYGTKYLRKTANDSHSLAEWRKRVGERMEDEKWEELLEKAKPTR
ncbi:MAG: hypothetical protein J7L23_00015 [Candidatus Diapherotrites archaeon]|nr:hypothetical protein [Candidatus Diapherotrites archaeon]